MIFYVSENFNSSNILRSISYPSFGSSQVALPLAVLGRGSCKPLVQKFHWEIGDKELGLSDVANLSKKPDCAKKDRVMSTRRRCW